MAQIIRGGAVISSQPSFDEANTLATNYWGSLAQEKMFPIPFWQVSQMLAASSSDQIALRVTNINNPGIVDARWMVFEEALADALQDPVEQGIYYFLLEDQFFNGPILTATEPPQQLDGMRNITNTPENNIVRGRIGIVVATQQFVAFFQAAECTIIDPGSGGGGATSGVRVPPQG